MIRPATTSDVGAIAGLERILFGADAWTEAQITEELVGAGRQVLVIATDSQALVSGPARPGSPATWSPGWSTTSPTCSGSAYTRTPSGTASRARSSPRP